MIYKIIRLITLLNDLVGIIFSVCISFPFYKNAGDFYIPTGVLINMKDCSRINFLVYQILFVFMFHGKIGIPVRMLSCTGHPFLIHYVCALFTGNFRKIDVI